MKTIVVFSAILISCLAQRTPYAARLPVGFPYVQPSTSTPDPLGKRFGAETGTTTAIRLLEPLGDLDNYHKRNKLTIYEQSYWPTWKALGANGYSPHSQESSEPHSFINLVNNTDNNITVIILGSK